MSKGLNSDVGDVEPGGIFQKIQQLQKQLAELQAKLAEETVTAAAGGVEVTMTGDQKCKSVLIAPDLLKEIDAVQLQSLILSTVNKALDQSRELASKRLGPLAGPPPP